nr:MULTISPECIES: diguanylate cyclase [unclassified Halomonas]
MAYAVFLPPYRCTFPPVATLCQRAVSGRISLHPPSEGEQELNFQQRIFKAFATPLRDESGQVTRCLLLTQDITRLKDDQKALETLNQELDRLARTDSLLGISNRRELDRHLEAEWLRGGREGHSLALLLIDVDCFKRYNDVHGHPAGDASLQQVASVLSEAIRRPGDLAARYGGEEMAVLLPHTEMEGALYVAQRIHELLAERNITFLASPVSDRVTVSIGVAVVLPTPEQTPQQLIEQADQALYQAKSNGRSRTEVYREEALLNENDRTPP